MTCVRCGEAPGACPCGTVRHPWPIANPPGLPTIGYRPGDYAAFRHALLRALPGETELGRTEGGTTVAIWRPGGSGDLAVQMIEWWAYLADVIGFYNERIANQAYLGTADLPESVDRLIRLLGYRPRPGIGATATLAAILAAPRPVTLPAGFKVQSKPGPGEKPQVFELAAATVLRPPDIVAARVVAAPGALLSVDRRTVWVAGASAEAKAGDRLLLANTDAVAGGDVRAFAWATVASVVAARDAGGEPVTAIRFAAAVNGIPADAAAADYALLRSTQAAPLWSARPAGWTAAVAGNDGFHLAGIVRDLAPGTLALVDTAPGAGDGRQALVTVSAYREPVWFANGNGAEAPAAAAGPAVAIAHSRVSVVPPLAADWDAFAASTSVRFGWRSVGRLVGQSVAADDALAATSKMRAAGAPFPVGAGRPVLLRDAAGRAMAGVGTVGADDGIMLLERLVAAGSAPPGPDVDALFALFTVSRGETVADEVLGDGNAAIAGQDFTLRKSPVTYFADAGSASGDGFASTVRVWVNGLRWSEVASFFDQPADAEVFTTREDEAGKTHIVFGDGVNGRCPPTGTGNVVASYRVGSGAAAPAAGTLTAILQPQPGLRSLANPIAAAGGADPEAPDRIRRLAPRSVLTFRRAIALDDYAVVAAAVPGVARAGAAYRFDPVAQRPGVTLWVAGDAGAVGAVKAAIAAQAAPHRPITVLAATAVATRVALTYLRDPRHRDDDVRAALAAALLDADAGTFGVNVLAIGEAVHDSQIYAACLAVPGVVAVRDFVVDMGDARPALRPWRRPGRPIRPAGCAGERHDPGVGRYLAVSAQDLSLTGEVAP